MNELVLFDAVGGLRHFDFHPNKPILVYDAGIFIT